MQYFVVILRKDWGFVSMKLFDFSEKTKKKDQKSEAILFSYA